MFSTRKPEPPAPASYSPQPPATPVQSAGLLSREVSIKGSIKFSNQLTIGGNAHVQGEIRTKSVKVKGTVEGNIFATERCELEAGCTLKGDIEAPRLVVDENATFLGSAKVAMTK